MDNAITLSVSPLQVLLSVAFQAWIIIFPILILKKLNYLIELLHAQFEDDDKETHA